MTPLLAGSVFVTGCALNPHALFGAEGEPIAVQDILNILLNPEYANDERRLEELQRLGMSDALAQYFLDHDISYIGHVGPWIPTYDPTITDPVVEVVNKANEAIAVTLTGLTVPGRFSLRLGPKESESRTLPSGSYSYKAVAGAGVTPSTGRCTFHLHYRYTWEFWIETEMVPSL